MNAYLDSPLFMRRFERAIREPTSMPCPYPDWDDPANWEQFTGNTEKIPDGEIVLVFMEGAWGLMHSANMWHPATVLYDKEAGR